MSYRLDTRSLQIFLAVAESLSFRQAAEMMHMSQPPLSRAVKNFEARLGAKLFQRTTTEVRLTALGRALVPEARRILETTRRAEERLLRRAEPQRLRLGLTNAVEPQFLNDFARDFSARHPSLHVETVFASSPRLVQLLRRNRIDAAFLALPTETRDLKVVDLFRDSLCVAVCARHRLAKRRTLSLDHLGNERLFWFERGRNPAFYDYCREVFEARGYHPDTIAEPADHHVLLSGIAEGKGVALLPRSFARIKRRGVSYVRLKEGDVLFVRVGLALPAASERRFGSLERFAGTYFSR